MMWEAIQYVTGGLTLIAFLAAVAAGIYTAQVRARERVLTKVTDKNHRAEQAQEVLEWFKVDTANLSREQKYDLAVAQIRAREKRYAIAAGVVCLLTVVFGGLTAYAISVEHNPSEEALRQVQMRINGIDPGEKSDAEVQITAFVNGEAFTYPSLAGVRWMKIAPGMSPATFDLQPARAYTLRFEGKLRVHDRSQTLFDASDVVTEYPLAS